MDVKHWQRPNTQGDTRTGYEAPCRPGRQQVGAREAREQEMAAGRTGTTLHGLCSNVLHGY